MAATAAASTVLLPPRIPTTTNVTRCSALPCLPPRFSIATPLFSPSLKHLSGTLLYFNLQNWYNLKTTGCKIFNWFWLEFHKVCCFIVVCIEIYQLQSSVNIWLIFHFVLYLVWKYSMFWFLCFCRISLSIVFVVVWWGSWKTFASWLEIEGGKHQ